MIEIKIKHRNCRMHLILENKITVLVGNSATGKSTIHKAQVLKDALSHTKLSDTKYSILHLSGETEFKAALNKDEKSLKSYFVYVIDEGSLSIDDAKASIIKRSMSCYFIITSRGGLGKLNFALNATKELITNNKGITVLKDYITTEKQTEHDRLVTKLNSVLIEDTGKAKTWFIKLFSKLEDIDIKSATSGKDTICNDLVTWLDSHTGNILVIFDECSFGNNAIKFKGVINEHGNEILILSNYKSWEFLILNSNMYKDKFVQYTVSISNFEESYYEELLKELSSVSDGNHAYTTINHDTSSKLSKCYTDKCCAYQGKNTVKCNYGLSGEDKFIALLKNTAFEELLLIARRI